LEQLKQITPKKKNTRIKEMRDNYDFSKIKGRKNPYIKYLTQPVTIRLDRDSVEYFKSLTEETGIPYQTLINLYLRDCAVNKRKLHMQWAAN
jgi:uncharacterized protein (DUF4415 family)